MENCQPTDPGSPSPPLTVYTIGHSNVPAERIIALLQQHDIQALVDIRGAPYSRYNPQFNRESLRPVVTAAGLDYIYMGRSLSGRPPGKAGEGWRRPKNRAGMPDFSAIAQRPTFLAGLDALMRLAEGQRVAIMCAEENPMHCHRHFLVSKALLERGVTVWHIRGDGRLEKGQLDRPAPPEPTQLRLDLKGGESSEFPGAAPSPEEGAD